MLKHSNSCTPKYRVQRWNSPMKLSLVPIPRPRPQKSERIRFLRAGSGNETNETSCPGTRYYGTIDGTIQGGA